MYNTDQYNYGNRIKQNKKCLHYVYVLECGKDKYYVGMTENLIKRIVRHICGAGADFTRTNRPTNLVHLEFLNDYNSACEMEVKTRNLVRCNALNFYLPENFRELFYKIMANVTPSNPTQDLFWSRWIEKECLAWVDLPKVKKEDLW